MFRRNYNNTCEHRTYERQCLYCDETVVYRQNEYGSGVLFEDFGIPWEKHNCQEFLNTECATVYIRGAGEKRLYWVKLGYDTWYQLSELSENISSLRYNGVYIIWYFDASNIARSVKVGSGHLWSCLESDRTDPKVRKYADRNLHVTWALVLADDIDDISVSLIQKLQPFVGQQRLGNLRVFVELPTKLKWN